MKNCFFYVCILLLANSAAAFEKKQDELNFFSANDPLIQFFGRVDFSDTSKARIWAPGAYLMAKFKGSDCEVLINDQASGSNHNYLEIVVDGNKPYRIMLTDKTNVIKLPAGQPGTEHTVLICKDTESSIGYIDVVGLKCEKLLPLPAKPKRKIEYFGDSITTGTGMDLSSTPCDKGQWFDQHNAYMSYGASTARNLNAQWQITAQAGIGLVHSCCNMTVTMPDVYDKVFIAGNTNNWDFEKYQPQVVTICLGQNDGKQDSVLFCGAYVKFIEKLRSHYPKANIICLTSPMADSTLTVMLQNYLTGITGYINATGDKKVSRYFFTGRYHHGCGGHPDMDDHQLIANELTDYIKKVEGWE